MKLVFVERHRGSRECELASAFARSSPLVARLLPSLRKCCALITRDDGGGVIVQRIIGTDPVVVNGINKIFTSLGVEPEREGVLSLGRAIDYFGWMMIREITLVALLHSMHSEIGTRLGLSADQLDSRALALFTAGSELGAGFYAPLFANVGELALAVPSTAHDAVTRAPTPEELVRAERVAFGFNHGQLGAYMLNEVGFPGSICEEVLNHAKPGTPIWTAELLAAEIGYQGVLGGGSTTEGIFETLPLSPRRIARLRASMKSAALLPQHAFLRNPPRAA